MLIYPILKHRRYSTKTVLFISLLLISQILYGCYSDRNKDEGIVQLSLNNSTKLEISTSAANLMTSAIIDQLNVDVVFYPTGNLNEDSEDITLDLSKDTLSDRLMAGSQEDITALYSTSTNKNTILTSVMSGSAIKKFILERLRENHTLDVHTGGVSYYIIMKGGEVKLYEIMINDATLYDDKKYSVA